MMNKKILTTILLLAFSLCIQLTSSAITANGNLTSAFWVRENRLENPQDAKTNLFIYEYLNLFATNLGSPKLAVNLSGRAKWDKINGFDEKDSLRIYQGYIDWKESNKVSLRLGRQFLPNDVGLWQMDGLRIETFRSGFISPSFYAGAAVLPWTINGDKEPLLGVEVGTKRLYGLRSKLNFLAIFYGDKDNLVSGLDKAIVGIQIDKFGESILEILESPHNRLNLYGRGSVDIISKKVINSYLFANMRVTPKINLSLGYQQDEALFPADSIFSVFNTETFRQLNANADYQIIRSVALQGDYTRQFFDSGPVDRYSAGIAVTSKFEPVLTIRLERLNDLDTNYWRVYSHIGKQFGQRLEIGLSNYYNNYRLTKSLHNENAYSFQLRTSYQLSRNLHVLFRVEDNINPDYKYNIRALGYLRMGFGLGK